MHFRCYIMLTIRFSDRITCQAMLGFNIIAVALWRCACQYFCIARWICISDFILFWFWTASQHNTITRRTIKAFIVIMNAQLRFNFCNKFRLIEQKNQMLQKIRKKCGALSLLWISVKHDVTFSAHNSVGKRLLVGEKHMGDEYDEQT